MFSPEEFFSLETFAHSSLWKENTPVWTPLIDLEDYLQKTVFKIEIEIPPFVHLIHPEKISIGKGTILEPGVCIEGPCILGEECHIRHSAFLRSGVLCGNRCSIGHSAEVKHSILLDEAHATHFTYVGDSILGNKVNLGAGVKCANLRLDRREVKPGLRKMSAIVGDRTQVGCNCVLNPGTLIGKDCLIYPLLNVGGLVSSRTFLKRGFGGARETSKVH